MSRNDESYAKRFTKAVFVRAMKTLCQAAVGGIGTAVVMSEVDFMYVISSSLLAGLVSVLMSVAAGLPEVKMPELQEGDV